PRARRRPRAARRRRGAASRPRGSSCPRARSLDAPFPAGSGTPRPPRPPRYEARSPPCCRARASRGPTGRARIPPSRGGTAARARGPPGRTAPCRRRRPLPPRSARIPTACRPGGRRSSSGRGSRGSANPREPTLRLEPLGVGLDVLLRNAQLLGRVHRQPQTLVAVGAQAPRGRELGEGRRLVVAPLGETVDRRRRQNV